VKLLKLSLLLLLSLLMPVLISCKGKGHYETDEIVHGYRGKARVNSYLAAERLLREGGAEVKTGRVWPSKDRAYEIQTIFMPASFLSTKRLGKQALEWVGDGGFLVVFLEGGEARINDFVADFSEVLKSDDEEVDEHPGFTSMLEELEVEIGEEGRKTNGGEEKGHLRRPWQPLTISGENDGNAFDYDIELEGKLGVTGDYLVDWDERKEGYSRMATQQYGDGVLMILSHARPFRNAFIERAEHAEFVEAVASWIGRGEILFLTGVGDTFFGLLWKHAWQAIVACFVLLFAWLWAKGVRFGPILEDGEIKKREHGSHLLGAARFLWHQGQGLALLKPLRERVGDHHIGSLAKEGGLEKAEAEEALFEQEVKDPNQLIRITRNLQILNDKKS